MGTATVTISKSAFDAFLREVEADFGISGVQVEEKETDTGTLLMRLSAELDDHARFHVTEAGLRRQLLRQFGSEALPAAEHLTALAESQGWALPRLGAAPWLQHLFGFFLIAGIVCLFIYPLYALAGLVATGFAAWLAERNGHHVQSRNLDEYVHALTHVNYDQVLLGQLPALEPEAVLLELLAAHVEQPLTRHTQLRIEG